MAACHPIPNQEPPTELVRPDADPVREKLAAARTELSPAVIERDDGVDLVLTAPAANEHVLPVGPPGCGKGLLLDSALAWTGGTKFSILLTKFTTVEEVMGPVSLAALKADGYPRVTAGKLPEADYAFADEGMKASSAIPNCLLRILNERAYDPGDGVARRVPLELCLGASNEWPSPDTGKELAALSDRFTLRKSVSPIRSRAGRQKLLWTRDHAPRLSSTVSPAEVERARRRALALPWSADAREAVEVILKELAKEGVQAGDRRQYTTAGVVRAFAYLCGADEVLPEHLGVAQHCLWDAPDGDQPQRAARAIARVANPGGMRVTQLLLEVEQVLAAADARNLADAARAAAKLAEIGRQLAGLRGDGRVGKARSYLKDRLKELKLASIEAVGTRLDAPPLRHPRSRRASP